MPLSSAAGRMKLRQFLLVSLAFLGFLALVLGGLYISERRAAPLRTSRDTLQRDFRGPGQDVDASALWIEHSEAELQQLRDSSEQLRSDLQQALARWEDQEEHWRRTRERLEDLEQREAGARAVGAEVAGPAAGAEFTPQEFAPAPLPGDAPLPSPEAFAAASAAAPPGADFLAVAVDAPGDPASGGDPAAARTHRVAAYLPSGSFVTAMLLTGLDAPTGGLARGNPLPVLLALVDDGRLPNRFRHGVRECQVTAAGHGDLAAERAYLRLERLSCVLRDGRVLDLPVRGYVVGEDGKAGLRGRVVSKQGTLIARSLLAGVAGGIGEGLSQSLTNVSTNALGSVSSVDGGKLAEYGLARGAGDALDRIARWYLERAEEVYPVLEVSSGRQVDIVLTEGLKLGADLPVLPAGEVP